MLGLKKKKSVLGLDIGTKATKIVQLCYDQSGKPALERCDLLDVGRDDEGFEGSLRSYIRENRVGHALVASSIDDPSLKIRKVELPKMPPADLVEAIRWNMRDIVEGDIDEFTVNYSLIREYKDAEIPRLELMAFAVKRDVVTDYQNRLQSLGVQPFFIEPDAVSLAATLERCHGEDERYIAGVDIGNHHSLFYVVGHGVFVFSRPLSGISLAAKKKNEENFNQKLAIDVQKSIDTFKVNFKMEDIHKMYLSGGGALLNNVAGYLTTNLGIRTDVLNPFSTLGNVESFEGLVPPLFAQAVALAYLEP